jgi:hypothetical protein
MRPVERVRQSRRHDLTDSAGLPVNSWPKGGQPGDPGSANWDTNNVTIRLKDGGLLISR